MNIQELIVNLKVLESLETNQKLITKETILNIESLSIIPESARRWLRQDNREESIKKITNIVDSAINIIESKKYGDNNNLSSTMYYDCKEDNEVDINNVNIIDYLVKSKKGLHNLKNTYSACKKTVAKIDWIIDKIDNASK
tara:strand:- start:4072 stop:4494 length:423 start_codon:yes stop_codon:yes gene_type:complete